MNECFSNEWGCWENAMKMSNNAKNFFKNIGKPMDDVKKMFRELGNVQKKLGNSKRISSCVRKMSDNV